ncbi:MAG: M23 family metallopeptidase [Candidatus Schekmanbacteria bacterium]|nr:M23 family metallopeptidase [Candidatus Schekmanbacteria bacterium]
MTSFLRAQDANFNLGAACSPLPGRLLLAACLILALSACAPAGGSATQDDASPPLPWPTDGSGHGGIRTSAWIMNTFGQYQGAATPDTTYLHDGIDFLAPNGTPIYALQTGRVRHLDEAVEYYKYIVIEDESAPGFGWSYAHVDNFRFRTGDRVRQGQQIASISFQGMEHVHLSRVTPAPGGAWSDVYGLISLDSTAYFTYDDDEAPAFDPPLRYFSGDSGARFAAGQPTVVAGRVEVVAGIRDGGADAHDPVWGVGDRLAVARVEVEIAGATGVIWRGVAFDGGTLRIRLGPTREADVERALTVYRFPGEVVPGDPSIGDRTFSYYELMRRSRSGRTGEPAVEERDFYWDTEEKRDGVPLYPDGLYSIIVIAVDAAGNESELRETVEVRNV